MDIKNAETQVFLDGQPVRARGITSNDEYLTLQDAEVPPILGKQTLRVVYPNGYTWERVCEARLELTDGGWECRYYISPPS